MPKTSTKTVRVVQATHPETGDTITRQSRTMHYTHALIAHYSAIPAYTIPAGTYRVPAKRIRGRNIRSYSYTMLTDSVHEAKEAGWGWVSFHTSLEAAHKAGRALVSKSASVVAEQKEIYGDLHPGVPRVVSYELVEAVQI